MAQLQFTVTNGYPTPYGTSKQNNGINFALFSENATAVTLVLLSPETREILSEIPLDPQKNRTGNVWHIQLNGIEGNLLYAYRIKGENTPATKGRFNPKALLLDPYAKAVATTNKWGEAIGHGAYLPLGVISPKSSFDWGDDRPLDIPLKDLVIYEMHVRGYTQDPSSQVNAKGSFLGVIDKIPHLLELGINAVELMPLQEFNECEYTESHPRRKKILYNYWGYSTVNFFAPMNRYASQPGAAITEFKMMVKELHRNGIEVILDVVFNHTFEGNEKGPVLSYKGIENKAYYLLDGMGRYLNFSGCGNTVNCNHPVVREWIIDCLRYWALEMHVDGFRFDLATILNRDTSGGLSMSSALVDAISADPILANLKLFSEAWDAAGAYQVGSFHPQDNRWSEWNGKYRDDVRRFIKGDQGFKGIFATRLAGSQDYYQVRTPLSSTNFITVHDGFTLADLVSYNGKHNIENGENNHDGESNNFSWNCGCEGPTVNKKVIALRNRQIRNLHLALMISQGVPLLMMGDEYAHTKRGNNNTWCQDNDLNWFQWNKLAENQGFYRFYRSLIHYRKETPLFCKGIFLSSEDIEWHGVVPSKPNWDSPDCFIAFILKSPRHKNLYIAFNCTEHVAQVEIPAPPPSTHWQWVVNTASVCPADFFDAGKRPPLKEKTYKMMPHSAILLEASNQ